MRLTNGELSAWTVTAAALETIAPDEREFVPDYAESLSGDLASIGRVPGAFNLDGSQLQSIALNVFLVASACVHYIAPKLFDASLDIAKDIFKKTIDKPVVQSNRAATGITAADAARIHEFVLAAATERNLSNSAATAIANAVVAHLAIGA